MQDLVDDGGRHRAKDMELLKTGQYSDAQLIAGTRVWSVHKAIVCRSGFFDKEFSSFFNAGHLSAIKIRHQTENEVELLVEFIYSGRIKSINDLELADCVQLVILGDRFDVSGMIKYAEKTLWDKLTSILQALSTLPPNCGVYNTPSVISIMLDQLNFDKQFTDAVTKAYGSHRFACRLILADFVWAASPWLRGHPTIQSLNVRYPQFGSHVFTTWNSGPQSSFIQGDGQLTSNSETMSRILWNKGTQGQGERPDQAMQLSAPKRE